MARVSTASAAEAVLFRKEVLPIPGPHCFKYHDEDKAKGALNFRSRSPVLERKDSILVPGHSAKSSIIALVTSLDEEERKPPKQRTLNTEEISVLKRWIDEGTDPRHSPTPVPVLSGSGAVGAKENACQTHYFSKF